MKPDVFLYEYNLQ